MASDAPDSSSGRGGDAGVEGGSAGAGGSVDGGSNQGGSYAGDSGSGGSGEGGGGGDGQGGAGAAGGGAGSGAEGGTNGEGGSGAAGGAGAGGGGGGGFGAEGASGGEGGALVFTELPSLEMSANPNVPLVGELTLATNRRARVRIAVSSPLHSSEHQFTEFAERHADTVLGFVPQQLHRVSVSVEDESGETLAYEMPLEALTPPLPSNFPKFTVSKPDAGQGEQGILLTGVQDLSPAVGGYVILLDKAGNVLWYHYDGSSAPRAFLRSRSGNILRISSDRRTLQEFDLRGREVRRFVSRGPLSAASRIDEEGGTAAARAPAAGAVEVPVDSFHHELLELGSGNLVTLSSEMRAFDGYPTSELDLTPRAAPHDVVGSVVVELTPDGSVARRFSLLDVLDPYRVAWGSFGADWQAFYGDTTNTDWSHGNGVVIDPTDDGIIVSSRNQDALCKISSTGQLIWVLADPANWDESFEPYLLKPKGVGFAWPYHAHAPKLTPRGTLLLFDNGYRRASPPDVGLPAEARYSRAVEFAIDEVTGEVEIVWDYGSTVPDVERFHSLVGGGADELPQTGNVLVTATLSGALEGEASAVIREVTRTEPAEVVFELQVEDDNPIGPGSRVLYRTEVLPSLYPE